MKRLVSVVIPARNASKTLEASIESVIRQEYDNLEIIIAVNGSTDNTLSVARSFNDSRVKVIETQAGIVPALNSALKISKGKYIARQDADDVWLEGKLNRQIEILENSDVDILGTQMIIKQNDQEDSTSNYPIDHDNCVNWLFEGRNPIGHPTVVFRQSLLEKVGGYWDAFSHAEDFDLWMRSLIHAKFANTDTPGIIYNHVPNPDYDPRHVIAATKHYRKLFGIKSF